MKISVITIAIHKDPRFVDMARTLFASLEHARAAGVKELELEWLVVDLVDDRSDEFEEAAGDLEGIYLLTERDAELNEARNLALAEASGDYVVMLDDCALVTASFVRVVAAAAALENGLRFIVHSTTQWPIPENGLITDFESGEVTFIECAATSAAGICFGAPMGAFTQIEGFDIAYDDGVGYSDIDACIRLGRAGVTFATSSRGWVIQQLSYSTEENTRSVTNKKILNALTKDRERVVPQDRKTEGALVKVAVEGSITVPHPRRPTDTDITYTPDSEAAPDNTPEEVSGDSHPGYVSTTDGKSESLASAASDNRGRDLSDTPEPEPGVKNKYADGKESHAALYRERTGRDR